MRLKINCEMCILVTLPFFSAPAGTMPLNSGGHDTAPLDIGLEIQSNEGSGILVTTEFSTTCDCGLSKVVVLTSVYDYKL